MIENPTKSMYSVKKITPSDSRGPVGDEGPWDEEREDAEALKKPN